MPPDVAAHPVDVNQFVDPVKFQYTVLGALKVMPEQPAKLPMRVPEIGAAVPVTCISRKSISVKLGVAFTTTLYVNPTVLEYQANRRLPAVPVVDHVPEITTVPSMPNDV